MIPRTWLFVLLLLLGCGPNKEEVVRLTKQLQSKESHERNAAAMALAGAGEHASIAVPALIRALSDPNGGVKSSAAYALRKIDTPEARAALASH